MLDGRGEVAHVDDDAVKGGQHRQNIARLFRDGLRHASQFHLARRLREEAESALE
jgi:hypothetical protein